MRRDEIITKTLRKYRDPQKALRDFGLAEAVIKKFGDQLTVDDYLAQARVATQGAEYATRVPVTEDSETCREMIRDVAIHWLRSAGVGEQTLLHHRTAEIRKFGQRMYLALNPDDYSNDKLAGLQEGWNL